MRKLAVGLVAAAALFSAVSLLAITYGEVEAKCPLDGTTNKFQRWASYGSYVYQYPSKYQFLFFPYTSSYHVWSCHKCRFTAFPSDFEKLPREKVESVRQSLAALKLEPEPTKDYRDVPVSERMTIAETVYRTLGASDSSWCFFYRLQGYFFEQEDKPEQAAEARRKALELAEQMAVSEEHKGVRKQLLYIAGAMHYFLGEPEAALGRFREALPLQIVEPGSTPEESSGQDRYLTNLIKEFIAKIEKGEPIPTAKDDR
jgi:hypothetical protein